MKLKHLIAIGALAAVATGGAMAQTVTIHIVASNGDRTATQTAISNLLGSNWTYRGTGITTSGSSANLADVAASNFGAWNGTYTHPEYGTTPVVIKVSYSGALAGIAAIAGNTDQRFVVTDGTGNGPVTNPLSGSAVKDTDYVLHTADFGFSTNFQATSPFNGSYEGTTYNPVVEENVGVSPLGFYASPGFPSGLNITTQLAQLLYTNGAVPLSLFTGNHDADANKIVYAIGRNTDAGQRFGAYAEVGLGTSTAVRVWQPTFFQAQQPTTVGTITYGGVVQSQELWPVETVSGIFSPLGSGGFSSGALLAQNLTVTLGPDAYKGKYIDEDSGLPQFLYPNATAGYYLGYVTPGDATNRILGGNGVVPPANRGVALSYNGVELTTTNVKTGRYTAWLYNRIIKPQSGLEGVKLAFANALRDRIKSTDAVAGGGIIDDGTFKVRRTTDGGLVVPK
ncbi:hypothetical protein JIN84_15770 [Luteolibacter yonseiensis]|uniref:Uncharacterized protein n=1 Tax=Luteolibacter yonseiensis TaxID=1144680 RepID=A0A934R643_9BACT|nr:hypothetical protein [Luteolibacter yonseiensis]MBK1817082.1 hypothetical protein [Luteolibacter yonseiensis]